MIEQIHQFLCSQFLAGYNIHPKLSMMLSYLLGFLLIAVITVFLHIIIRRVIMRSILYAAQKSKNQLDDLLVEHKVFGRLVLLIPGVIIHISARFFPVISTWVEKSALVYIVIVSLLIVYALLNTANSLYEKLETAKSRPIKGYIQIFQIVFFGIAILFTVTILMESSPWKLLSGIGAMSAILLLVFKDSILGLVAGFQLTVNNMVRIGDSIEMPKYGADGAVIDISLTSVKVQNGDKTYTTIPTYALVSDSFKNWRGMEESGGRRIKRALYIDMNGICFYSKPMLEKLYQNGFVKHYLLRQPIQTIYQEGSIPGESTGVNSGEKNTEPTEPLETNIGLFRVYVTEYLKAHPKINQNMPSVVRQLAPTATGLPIEIYAFTNETALPLYEKIQADIFDHLIAIIPEFNLRIFQSPTDNVINRNIT